MAARTKIWIHGHEERIRDHPRVRAVEVDVGGDRKIGPWFTASKTMGVV